MPSTSPTQEQLRAIAKIEQDMPVTAGAGSGKTFVLTHRYLQILAEQHANLDEILTITFTEKAANQMKKKIRDLITRFARGEQKEGFPPVIKEGMNYPERTYWRELLDNFERTYISTVHGFCSRILREQAVHVGLDPQFKVMDDHTMTLQRPEVVRRTIFRLIQQENPAIAHWLERYSLFQILNVMNQLISSRIEYSGLTDFYPDGENNHNDLQMELFQQSKGRYREKIQPVIDHCMNHQSWQHIRDCILTMIPKDTTDKFYEHYTQLKSGVKSLDEQEDAVELVSALIMIKDNLKNKGKKSSWENIDYTQFKKDIKAFRDKVLEPALSGITIFDEEIEKESIALAISGTRIFQTVLESYETWKTRRGLVDYDDLLIKAVELLQEHPSIRESYAGQFKHILLDEFQDTNPIQYELVQLLYQRSDPENRLNNNLFVVGDPKQSIYRFRGTDVGLFNKAKEQMIAQDAALSMSFRSQPGLLKWVDALFEKVMGREEEQQNLEEYEQFYSGLEANRENIQEKPHVSIHLVETSFTSESDDAASRSQLEAAYIAKWLIEELPQIQVEENGECRSAQFGDVAILFRRTTYLKGFEYALNLAGIPHVTVGGSGFFKKQEIQDLQNILSALTYPEDEITLAGVLRSAVFGMSDEGLLRLAGENYFYHQVIFSNELQIPDGFSESDKLALEQVRKMMQYWKSMKDRLNPGRLVDMICTDTGYLGVISTGKDGLQNVKNVEQFIQLAYNYGRTRSASLASFVNYIQSLQEYSDQEEAMIFEDEQDAVQLMTIHKSKGLEFPVVIIPQIDARPASYQPQKDFYADYGWALRWNDLDKPAGEQSIKPFLYTYLSDIERTKDLAESKRLFYVVNTRARDHLMLSGVVCKNGGIESYIENLELSRDNWLHWVLDVLRENSWSKGTEELHLINDAKVNVRIQNHLADDPLPAAADVLSDVKPTGTIEMPTTLSLRDIMSRWETAPVKSEIRELNPTSLRDLIGTPSGSEQYAGVALKSAAISGAEFGSMAHRLFEKFLNASEKERTGIVDLFVKDMKHPEVEDIRTELHLLLKKFTESSLFRELESSEIFTELPFVTSLNNITLSGQIDLLMRSGDEDYTIVDFKSDDIHQKDMHKTVQYYRPQILAYVYAIYNSTQTLPNKALLYFMRLGKTAEISVSLDDLTELEQKVKQAIM